MPMRCGSGPARTVVAELAMYCAVAVLVVGAVWRRLVGVRLRAAALRVGSAEWLRLYGSDATRV